MRSFLLLLALTILGVAAHAQRIVYTKVFPASIPAYVKITATQTGAVTYQEAVDEEPEKFQLDPASTTAIFDLAAKLDHFKRKLESGLKVARTGDKTYRWEESPNSFEVTFNYSQDEDARALQTWFERITETERMMADLRRTTKYDRLGVNDVLVRIDTSWQQKRLVAPAQFVSALDRVAKNDSFLHMAQERAALLSEAFKTAGDAPKTTEKASPK
ncbi:MAG: hypothetical protein ABI811_00825 [Acidobacteriota bacterium]